jgi:HPt (histidine-containing phosphotransfer) domain-containing protein
MHGAEISMSVLSELNANKQDEDIFLIRAITLIGGSVYPLWSLIYQYADPTVTDPISFRLQISMIALVIFGLTFIKKASSYLIYFIYADMILATIQLSWIAYLNQFSQMYNLGIIVLISVTLPFYQTIGSMIIYIAIISAVLIFPLFHHNMQTLITLYAGCGTVLFVSAAALMGRLILTGKLQKSRLKIAESAEQIDSVNRDIQSIMTNIKQGIFTIESSDGTIGAQYSRFLPSIFGLTPNSQTSCLDLFKYVELTDDQKSQIMSVINSIDGHLLEFEINSHLLPTAITTRESGGTARSLELEWSPVLAGDHETVAKILVSVRDVTEYNHLKAQNQERQRELQQISELIAIDKYKMSIAFESLRHLIVSMKKTLYEGESFASRESLKIFRDVHTIKGLARTYGLGFLAECAHHCEDGISRLKMEGTELTSTVAMMLTRPLVECFNDYCGIFYSKLGNSHVDDSQVIFDREDIKKRLAEVAVLDPMDAAQIEKWVRSVHNLFIGKVRNSLTEILSDLTYSLHEISHQVGKPMPRIVIHDPGFSFSLNCHELLVAVFTHLLRNAIDHGIEPVAERKARQKTERGQLTIRLAQQKENLLIYVRDDGAGLDLRRIRTKAIEKKLLEEGARPSASTLAQLIFLPDFSTKDQVTSISGRGVGMDAVRAYLTSFNATIDIMLLEENQEYCPFQFLISMPPGSFESLVGLAVPKFAQITANQVVG